MTAMGPYMLIFLAALALGLFATPVVRRLALATGVVDRPAARKVHARTTPLLGGVAIYAACAVAILVFSDHATIGQIFWIFIGATTVSFLGLWDDRRALP